MDDRTQTIDAATDAATETPPQDLFAALGFGFVHRFLWLVLAACCLLVGAGAALGWYLEGDVTVRAEGVIRPRARSVVKAGVDGVVQGVAVRGGDRVEAGDILMVLAPEDVRAQLAQVEDQLALSDARQRLLREQIADEQRVLGAVVEARRIDVARAALQLGLVRREQELATQHARPGWKRRPLDDLVPVRDAAAALAQARAQLRVAQRQVEASRARTREVELERRQWTSLHRRRQVLWQRLEGTVVRAPAAGVVLTRDLELRDGDHVEVGEILLELAEDDAWDARVLVRQIDRPKVRGGQPVRVFVRAYPHLEFGSIDGSVGTVAEQAVPGAASYPADVELEATDLALADGMAAEVRIAVDRGRLLELVWRHLLRELGPGPLPAVRQVRS